ncbi:MAG: ribosome-associated translation inhibitor RaiA [Campylobacteraceae bacterium]|jgi:putative sigma-54 modulation protein|nr:ribosome-associated translation inhibitor RaiA [Campylobacteraceae bacterium]
MNLSITGKQLELTNPIKEYIEEAAESLGKYNLDIISVRVIVAADEKSVKRGFNVDFIINLAKKETVVIKQKDKDLYAAVDLAIERAKKVLRRTHDKIITLKGKKSATDDEAKDNIIVDADEIVPMELELYKPLEIEEALQKLKDSGMQFYVFNDIDAKMRVIYKRSDNKFGLY